MCFGYQLYRLWQGTVHCESIDRTVVVHVYPNSPPTLTDERKRLEERRGGYVERGRSNQRFAPRLRSAMGDLVLLEETRP